MSSQKNDQYYVQRMLLDINFIIRNTKGLTIEKLKKNEVSMLFRIIQISETSRNLTDTFKDSNPGIPWIEIAGLRNHIVHVDLTIIYQTITQDIPHLKTILERT